MAISAIELHDFLLRFHEAADSLDFDHWISFWAPDAALQFANNPPIEGAEKIRESFVASFEALSEMKHEIIHTDVIGERIYHRVDVYYAVKGDESGERFKVRGLIIIMLQDWKVKMLDVFLDFSVVNARIAEVQKVNAGGRSGAPES